MRLERTVLPAILLSASVGLVPVASALAQEREGDKGEAPQELKLKGRTRAPAAADMDAAATLDALLEKNDKMAFSEAKGASIEGWVVQVEREDDGDVHLVLAGVQG